MKHKKASDTEVGDIIFSLVEATKRPFSGNFLSETRLNKGDGFPWTSVQWFKANLSYNEFENLYLFWDGIAWGEGHTAPRSLKQGTKQFMEIAQDLRRPNFEHITDILKKRDGYRAGNLDCDDQGEKRRYLILVAQSWQDPFMILDGNHRAIAALWWKIETGQKEHLPKSAWVGISGAMQDYYYYKRVFDAAKNARQ